VFARWLTMHDRCKVCGLQYLRKQGDLWLYWIVMDRIPIAIGLILIVFFGLRVATWQTGTLFFGGMVVPLIATMPQRQAVAVALNYLSRVYFRDPSDEIPPADAGER
jgi:uncharacterized protein (DUF983 family)